MYKQIYDTSARLPISIGEGNENEWSTNFPHYKYMFVQTKQQGMQQGVLHRHDKSAEECEWNAEAENGSLAVSSLSRSYGTSIPFFPELFSYGFQYCTSILVGFSLKCSVPKLQF